MSKLSPSMRALIAFVLMLVLFFGFNFLNTKNTIPDGVISVDCNRTSYRVNCNELFEGADSFTLQEMVDSVMKNPILAERVAVIGLDKKSVDIPFEYFGAGQFRITDGSLIDFSIVMDGETSEIKNVKWMFIE